MLRTEIVRFQLVLFLIIAANALEEQNNAVEYYIDLGNKYALLNDTDRAIRYYDEAIKMENQTGSLLISSIDIDSFEKSMRDTNTRVCASPVGKNISINFDITNPNSMEIRIKHIYINLINYYMKDIAQINLNQSVLPITGISGENRDYYSKIDQAIGLYECIKTTNKPDFIKISNGELEHLCINLTSGAAGVYQLEIEIDYIIGSENEKTNIQLLKLLEFF